MVGEDGIEVTALGLIQIEKSESNYLEPAKIALIEPRSVYSSYTEEQQEFLRLFDALPKSKREVLLTFMRDWINLK